ncbi:unnamed protein product [Polarella glacialis]|uniref:Uncharacterized protein n=1 Tax=Polarella glacialis TaxID=89957 RepID=A0A813JG59_POLGL|nr:unnamed protein product [Polarella glacialis]
MRVDEVEAHFQDMPRVRFVAAAREEPPVLLARLARQRQSSGFKTFVFEHMKGWGEAKVWSGGELELVLLRSEHEVAEAAKALKNCAAVYLDRAREASCFLAVLRRAGKLLAMGEWDCKKSGIVRDGGGFKLLSPAMGRSARSGARSSWSQSLACLGWCFACLKCQSALQETLKCGAGH